MPSQSESGSLSNPDVSPESCLHDAMDHDAFYHGGSSSSAKSASLDSCVSSEACFLLLAAEESAAHCADAMDASSRQLNAAHCFSAQQSALEGGYDLERHLNSMAPPKNF